MIQTGETTIDQGEVNQALGSDLQTRSASDEAKMGLQSGEKINLIIFRIVCALLRNRHDNSNKNRVRKSDYIDVYINTCLKEDIMKGLLK